MLARLTIRTRILAGFALALVLSLALGATSFVAVSTLSGHIVTLGTRDFPTAVALGEIESALHSATRGMNGLLAAPIVADPALRSAAYGLVEKGREALTATRRTIAPLFRHEEDAVAWRELDPKLAAWDAATAAFLAAARERDVAAGDARAHAEERLFAAYQPVRATFVTVAGPLADLSAGVEKDVAADQAEASRSARSYQTTVLVALLLGAAGIAAVGVLLARAIGSAIRGSVDEATRLRRAVEAGALAERGDPARVHADFRPIVAGFNGILDAYERPVRLTAEYVTRISKGDVPPKITDRYEGDFNRIKDALNRCIDAVGALVQDAGTLAKAGVEGRLQTRADASRHEGDFRSVVQGVNDTLDAVVGPLGVAARYVDDIAKGVVPEKITAEYRGDFDAIKRNLNTCVDSLSGLIGEMGRMAKEHDAGDIDVVVDAARFQGAWKTMAQGVNDMVAGHIAVKKKAMAVVAGFGRGDFEAPLELLPGKKRFINDTIEQVRANLKLLIADADRLVAAAIEGELSTRADAARHPGDFRKIVDGVNRTLDAVIAPVTEAAAVLDRLAERDLRARMTGSYRGDHARIQRAANGTAEALHEALAQVASSVEQVSSAATQIASSSQAVAAGASEQASSLEETSSSIDSVSAMTRASADHAHQAHLLVQGTREAATAGAAAVEQMQGAMSRIKASSEGTSQIIKDVSEIAFQTNLLALNAAVEAARAGEAGRGFAVVAEEVRSLALRAKEAATKTEALIRQSVKEANEGERSAGHVAGKLEEIAGGVGKVTAIVSEIAAAAKEQSAGIGQVSKAVAEMDKVTQQNAASAEESSSAASELSSQAEELAAMVASFRLDRGAGVLPAARRAPAPPRPAARALPAHATAHATAPRAASPGPARNGKSAHAEELFPMADGELKDF